MSDDERELSGGCLCGAVRFRARGPFRPVVHCHCKQCRVSHSNFVAYTAVPRANLSFETEHGLCWYRSSAEAQRGFCGVCGSRLFWNGDTRDYLSIAAGCLDEPTGLRAAAHIFVRDKGDCYEIEGDLPQHETGRDSPLRGG